MPEIENEVTIVVGSDQLRFNTQSNGDSVVLQGFQLTKGQAGALAYLVNSQCDLEIQIKVKSE